MPNNSIRALLITVAFVAIGAIYAFDTGFADYTFGNGRDPRA